MVGQREQNTSMTTGFYWLVPLAKPKDRMCQSDHKEGMFKGKLEKRKNANSAQIARPSK